ncbi:MAG: hypothetical protein O7D34_03165 [Ignavibacteria bacterium]|nr:hypothetical protein [Ignavibacteria bacterium]
MSTLLLICVLISVTGTGLAVELHLPSEDDAPIEGDILVGFDPYSNTPETYLEQKKLRSHYDRRKNRVVFYYNPQGKLLAPPGPGEASLANFDADDVFEIHIVHALADIGKYRTTMTPTDSDSQSWINPLSLIPPGIFLGGIDISTALSQMAMDRGVTNEPPSWTETVEVKGPFPSGRYALEIFMAENSDAEPAKIETRLVKINELQNFSIHIGAIVSRLQDPEYKITKLQGTPYNTISASSGPVRGLPTLNIIVYNWFFMRRKRDRAKDLGGIFPMVGVGLQKPTENLLAGLIWEISPIVSINAGVHFGKVSRLPGEFDLDEDILWEDSNLINEIEGTIETTDKWQSREFIGVTVDAGLLLKILLSPPGRN